MFIASFLHLYMLMNNYCFSENAMQLQAAMHWFYIPIGNNKNKALKKFLKNWKVEYYITNPKTEPDQKLFLHCSWIHMPMNLLQAIFSLVWTGKLNLIYTYHTFVH